MRVFFRLLFLPDGVFECGRMLPDDNQHESRRTVAFQACPDQRDEPLVR